jgi:undecaprenyl-diphosphatase
MTSSTRMTDLWSRLGRHEFALLATVLAIAGGLLAFALLADEVREGETRSFDHTVMLALRTTSDLSDPIGPPWVEEMARDLTSLGSITVLTLVSLAVIGFLILHRKRGAAVLVLTAVFGGMLLSTLLKAGFERPRPDLVPHAVVVFTKSFPSGHAMLSAVTYLTLGALLARVQPHRRVKAYLLILAILLTVMIGVSRVYLGVHWPTDVLAGWCVGATWAMLCWLTASWLQRRGHVEPDVQEPGGQDRGNA